MKLFKTSFKKISFSFNRPSEISFVAKWKRGGLESAVQLQLLLF